MKKHYYTRLAGKVLLATLVGILTMYSIHIAINHAFEEITSNFERLSRPNARLLAVNSLFRDISQLTQSQQAEAASGRRTPSRAFIQESKAIFSTIDTIRNMFSGDSIQSGRIDEIEQRLVQREKLFSEYLELLYMHNLNKDIRQLINNLSSNLERQGRDSLKVVQLYETITTTTISSDTIMEEPSGSFLHRMFGRIPFPEVKGIAKTETRVDKDLVVIIDTIEIQRNDVLIPILEYSLDSLYTNQLQQLALIQNQELELINTNSGLIHEIINIIKSVEQEEFARMNIETHSVFEIAQRTITNLNYLAVIFISASILLVMFVIIDIFKSKKYRKQLEEAHQEARRESEAKQRFLSNMSHEIRTPLQSIYGYTEHARIHPDQKANIEAIYLSARHLLKVVNEVLDYSKVTSGRIILEKRIFDPDKELKSVVTAMEPLSQQKGIKFTYESRFNQPCAIIGDPFRLRQILFNLIGNAIKFTNEGEVTVTAELKKGRQPVLIIRVRDTGIGIPEERIPELFTEFAHSTASASGSYDGTGLGLSIVHRLIKIQKGDIEVDSKLNEGSCFTVSIPYQTASLKPRNNNSKTKDAFTPVNIRSKTVMIVDDDPFILDLSSAIFRKKEVPHQTFSNGEDLLKALKEVNEAIIFLDMRMPGMSGLELFTRIREVSEGKMNLIIFALTAQVLPNERQAIMDNGFDGIITKPFKESDIMEALGQYAGNVQEVSPTLDLEPLFRMTGNDRVKIKLILETVLKESQEDLEGIQRSFDNNQRDQLILLTHRMAGRVGQSGDKIYAQFLREIERELQKDSDYEDIKLHINEALERGNLFVMEVRNWINNI
jgi:signal transduction histidine kinase/DNA-binding NarL/FixJ family response regulator